MSRQWLFAAAIAAIGVVGGFASYRALQSPPTSPIVAAPAPAVTAADTPRPIPETLPDVVLPDVQGHPTDLRRFRGQPLAINFWATWCAPCRREIPLLQHLRAAHRAERLEVIGIALDFEAAVKTFLAHEPLGYPVLIGESDGLQTAAKFGMDPVLPFTVFADAQGRIVALKVGELHAEEAEAILAGIARLGHDPQQLATVREEIRQSLQKIAVQRAKSPTESH